MRFSVQKFRASFNQLRKAQRNEADEAHWEEEEPHGVELVEEEAGEVREDGRRCRRGKARTRGVRHSRGEEMEGSIRGGRANQVKQKDGGERGRMGGEMEEGSRDAGRQGRGDGERERRGEERRSQRGLTAASELRPSLGNSINFNDLEIST